MIILKKEDRYGEIAPLPGFSKETLREATRDLLHVLQTKEPPRCASVQFGLSCLSHSFIPFRLPLCSLGIKEGFSTCKLKLGHLDVDTAIAFVKKHYRQKRLRLDWNRRWNLDQALHFASHFSPDDFDYLEEPVATFEELVLFSKKTGFPIALDEQIRADWRAIPSLTTLVVKPTLVGYIPKTDLKLVLSSSYESGIGLRHIARLATQMHLTEPVGLDTYRPHNDLLSPPIECTEGEISWIP